MIPFLVISVYHFSKIICCQKYHAFVHIPDPIRTDCLEPLFLSPLYLRFPFVKPSSFSSSKSHREIVKSHNSSCLYTMGEKNSIPESRRVVLQFPLEVIQWWNPVIFTPIVHRINVCLCVFHYMKLIVVAMTL